MARTELRGIAIGPEGIEGIGGVEGTPGVVVVSRTVLCDLFDELPCRSLITAEVFHDFATTLIRLRSGRAGNNYRPSVFTKVKTAGIVIVIGGADFRGLPSLPIPTHDAINSGIVGRSGLVSRAGEVEHYRMSGGIEAHVLHVGVESLGSVIDHPAGMVNRGDGRADDMAVNGGPGFTEILGLQVVEIGAVVDESVGVTIEEGAGFLAEMSTGLVVAREFVIRGFDRGEFLIGGPCFAVGTGAPIELTHPRVFGEKEELLIVG